MKRITAIAAATATLMLAGSASAQARPGGEIALSADRLFGFHYSKTSPDEGDGDITVTNFSLLGGNVGGLLIPFNLPRGSIDFFVTDGVSVGGSLIYVSTSVESDDGMGGTSKASISGFGFAPRAGYATMFSPYVGIWPRGGLTYMSLDDDDSDGSISGLALTLEVPFLFAPSNSVAITLGPTLDYALSASIEAGGDETDFNVFEFGIQAGLAGFI